MNILQYSAMRQAQFTNAMAECGHETKTTFYGDFSIADGMYQTTQQKIAAVKDTYNRAFKSWKNNYIYLTELVIVLNWKISEWYEKNKELSICYNDLWAQADMYACNNLKDDELSYFYRTTD